MQYISIMDPQQTPNQNGDIPRGNNGADSAPMPAPIFSPDTDNEASSDRDRDNVAKFFNRRPRTDTSRSDTNMPLSPYRHDDIILNNPNLAQAQRKPRKKIILVILLILSALAALVCLTFVFVLPLIYGKKIGDFKNDGPGNILIMTSVNDQNEPNYYRIEVGGSTYKTGKVDLSYSSDTGLSFIPLSCFRVALYESSSDLDLCDQDSPRPQDFGAEFFSMLRYALYEYFGEIAASGRLVPLRIFESNGRTFISFYVDNGKNVLLEYRDLNLSEIISFENEQFQAVEVTE